MSKISDLIAKLCPNGVEYKKLGEIATIERGNGLQKKDFVPAGVPCIHYGQLYTRFRTFAKSALTFVDNKTASNLKHLAHGDILMAVTSENVEDVCKCIAWLGEEDVVVGGHTAIIHHRQNPMYLAYWFQTEDFFTQKRKLAHGTKVIEVTPKKLEDVVLPVPPLEIQREVVEVLDKFALLTAELTAELEKRKKQYEHYRDKLLNFTGGTFEWLTLGEIGSVAMCKRILKSQTSNEGEIPFFKIGTFGRVPDAFISRELYDEYRAKYSYPKCGDILISAAGTIGRTVIYSGEPAYYQDSNIVWLSHDESVVLNKYLYYFYQQKPWRVSDGGTIPRLYNDNILKTKIAVPPLAEQERIVKILDRFDKLCNDLTSGLPAEIAARKKQYEYYRDKLLSFKRAG